MGTAVVKEFRYPAVLKAKEFEAIIFKMIESDAKKEVLRGVDHYAAAFTGLAIDDCCEFYEKIIEELEARMLKSLKGTTNESH